MLRKKVLTDFSFSSASHLHGIDIAASATVEVTSEAPDFPIDSIFDDRGGPGASRWQAAEPGEQRIILAFDTPQRIRTIYVEVEEQEEVSRTQELSISFSQDSRKTYQEAIHQEYNFSPPGTTFEREEWALAAEGVTHLQLRTIPDKGSKPCGATVTTFALS